MKVSIAGLSDYAFLSKANEYHNFGGMAIMSLPPCLGKMSRREPKVLP